MTDKERILMVIITRIIPGLAYSLFSERDKYIESCMISPEKLQPGDLVFANTAFTPNDFMVGFVKSIEPNCFVIRELGSDRLCNYFNEGFTKINKEMLGYEILEGIQYKTYQNVLKAFSKYTGYSTRFQAISFDGNVCNVRARKMFENSTLFKVSFPINSKTTIKEIGAKLTEAEAALLTKDGAEC